MQTDLLSSLYIQYGCINLREKTNWDLKENRISITESTMNCLSMEQKLQPQLEKKLHVQYVEKSEYIQDLHEISIIDFTFDSFALYFTHYSPLKKTHVVTFMTRERIIPFIWSAAILHMHTRSFCIVILTDFEFIFGFALCFFIRIRLSVASESLLTLWMNFQR